MAAHVVYHLQNNLEKCVTICYCASFWINKTQFSAEKLHSNITNQNDPGNNQFTQFSVGDRNKISDLVHSEFENQRRAKKPAATVTGPIGRFLVPIDKNQQTKQKSREKKSGQ